MKKTLLFAALLASTATFTFAQDGGPGPRGPRPNRKIELSKLPEQAPQELKDKMKAADKNGDGVLEGEELQGVFPAQGDGPRFGGFGGPGFGPQGPGFGGPGFGPQGPGFDGPGFGPQGPRFGGPGFGPQGPRFGEAFKDGKLELAKLPEQMPQERKDALKAADKDGDGFLTGEEMRNAAPKPEKPAFLADDGKIDVAKLTEAIKAADKNNDGFIDQDERKTAFEAAQKKFGPMFFARFAPAPFAPQWGAPQPWGGQRPQGDFNRGPRREGERPQGDWNRGPRRRGGRPEGDQPKPDAPKAE